MTKNLAIFGLAAASVVLAKGSLWNMDVDSYQVQTPERLACDQSVYDAQEDYGHCYEISAGWWFLYEGGGTVSFDAPAYKDDKGKWQLVTTDASTGKLMDPSNLVKGSGLVVGMHASGGTSDAPAIAGVGFNWTKAESEIDISANGGYCIAYNWTGSSDLQLELGWDDTKHPKYDTWFALLPPGSKALDLTWDKFDKVGYAKDDPTTIDDATKKAVSMKVRIKNEDAAEVSGVLTISELGKPGECGAAPSGGNTAIADMKVAAAKVMISNRTLSVAGLSNSANVEVVNLRGQVVASKVLNGSASMNLSSLDAGIYMIRVQGKSVNYAQKIILK
jgi:hypothetical protein